MQLCPLHSFFACTYNIWNICTLFFSCSYVHRPFVLHNLYLKQTWPIVSSSWLDPLLYPDTSSPCPWTSSTSPLPLCVLAVCICSVNVTILTDLRPRALLEILMEPHVCLALPRFIFCPFYFPRCLTSCSHTLHAMHARMSLSPLIIHVLSFFTFPIVSCPSGLGLLHLY
jgi:hypothetical protein